MIEVLGGRKGLGSLAQTHTVARGEVLTNSQHRTRIAAANQGTYITVKWCEVPEHAEGQVTLTLTLARVFESWLVNKICPRWHPS